MKVCSLISPLFSFVCEVALQRSVYIRMLRVVQQVIGAWRVSPLSTDQGTARIPSELKLPRGSGLCELYPIRLERRRAVNIPIAPLSLPPSPTPSVCSSHSSSPRFISRSLLSALADSNGKTERRVFHSPA